MRPLLKYPPRTMYNDAGDYYDTTRRALIESVGSYCAYCESPVTSDVPVEHKVPKSFLAVKDNANGWNNLLPACASCNSSKGSNPKGGGKTDADSVKVRKSLAMLVWPDTYDGKRGSLFDARVNDSPLRLFRYVLMPMSQNQLADAGCVKAPPRALATASAVVHTRVWVLPAEGLDANLLARVKATLTTIGLNSYNADNLMFNDRRVLNRTRAWDVAQRTIAAITATLPLTATADLTDSSFMRDLLIDAARHTLRANGFWSVWLTVMRNAAAKPPWSNFPGEAMKVIEKLFLIDPHSKLESSRGSQIKFPRSVLPGTDIEQVRQFLASVL